MRKNKPIPRVVIVYDRINKFGGAERVLQLLHTLYPDSVLCTSVYDVHGATWLKNWEVRTSFLQHIPFARRHHEWFAPLMPLAFESLNLSDFDIVISVTSEFAKAVITRQDQLHICLCLTPTRYLWSHTHEYGKGVFSLIKQWWFFVLRPIDFAIAARPDHYVAISKRVATRIKRYYRRDASLVAYPSATPLLHPIKANKKKTRSPDKKGYYLVVSRLVPYKHIDIAIRACIQARKRLVVVGTGSAFAELHDIAAHSSLISFRQQVGDHELSQLYAHATALLCPQEEDFGLVALEAQAHGTPVITYRHSGIAETIIEGKTGLVMKQQTVGALINAIHLCEKKRWNVSVIQRHAKKYDQHAFARQFTRFVQISWDTLQKNERFLVS